MRKAVILILVSLIPILLSSCRSDMSQTPTLAPEPTETVVGTETPSVEDVTGTDSHENMDHEAYPAPEMSAYPGPEVSASPAPDVSSYPAPVTTIDSAMLGPRFTIDEPLIVGDMQVDGTGAAGIQIRVVDITTVGETLGTGVIAGDGSFSIDLGKALSLGHSIGLQIGNLDGTTYSYDEFLRGPGYRDIPWVGVVLAQATVREP